MMDNHLIVAHACMHALNLTLWIFAVPRTSNHWVHPHAEQVAVPWTHHTYTTHV
jgi:hypothetical protein